MNNHENEPEGYEDRVVCFLDILGFKDLFSRRGKTMDGTPNLALYREVLEIFKEIANETEGSYIEEEVFKKKSVEMTYFSDSVVISCARRVEGAEERVLRRAGNLSIKLLLRGLASRGGIDYGHTYHGQGIVFGEGMFQAYYLESKVANFPRIVVAEAVGNAVKKKLRARKLLAHASFLAKSEGGVYYLDIFRSSLDGVDGKKSIERLKKVSVAISGGLSVAREGGRPDILAKWVWLKEQFNREIRRLAKGSNVQINVVLVR